MKVGWAKERRGDERLTTSVQKLQKGGEIKEKQRALKNILNEI